MINRFYRFVIAGMDMGTNGLHVTFHLKNSYPMRLIIPAAAKNQKDDQTKQNSKWEPIATKFMKNPAPDNNGRRLYTL